MNIHTNYYLTNNWKLDIGFSSKVYNLGSKFIEESKTFECFCLKT